MPNDTMQGGPVLGTSTQYDEGTHGNKRQTRGSNIKSRGDTIETAYRGDTKKRKVTEAWLEGASSEPEYKKQKPWTAELEIYTPRYYLDLSDYEGPDAISEENSEESSEESSDEESKQRSAEDVTESSDPNESSDGSDDTNYNESTRSSESTTSLQSPPVSPRLAMRQRCEHQIRRAEASAIIQESIQNIPGYCTTCSHIAPDDVYGAMMIIMLTVSLMTVMNDWDKITSTRKGHQNLTKLLSGLHHQFKQCGQSTVTSLAKNPGTHRLVANLSRAFELLL